MIDIKEMVLYIWVFLFSLVVGVISFFKKQEKDTHFSFRSFILGVGCSMVVGYMCFEVAFFYFEKEKLAVAIAGLGAWMGTDALLELEIAFKKHLNKNKGDK